MTQESPDFSLKLSRRELLKLGGIGLGTMLLGSCSPLPELKTPKTEKEPISTINMQIWDIESGKLETEIDYPYSTISTLSYNGHTLALYSHSAPQKIHIRNLFDPKEDAVISVTTPSECNLASRVNRFMFTPDSQLLLVEWIQDNWQRCSSAYTLRGKQVDNFPLSSSLLYDLSEDGRWGQVGGSEGMTIIDRRTGKNKLEISDIKSWAISADGNTFAIISHYSHFATRVRVWDLEDEQSIQDFGAHCCQFIYGINLSWDGRIGAIGFPGSKNTMIWDMRTGALIGSPGDEPIYRNYSENLARVGMVLEKEGQRFQTYDPRIWYVSWGQARKNSYSFTGYNAMIVNKKGVLAQKLGERIEIYDLPKGRHLHTLEIPDYKLPTYDYQEAGKVSMGFIDDDKKLAFSFPKR